MKVILKPVYLLMRSVIHKRQKKISEKQFKKHLKNLNLNAQPKLPVKKFLKQN